MNEPELVLTASGLEYRYDGEIRQVSAEDLTKALPSIFAPSGIFQPAVRWISMGSHAIIMERPPFIARVSYRPGVANELADEDAQHYQVPVPWTVYGIVFSADFREITRMFVFARNSPILSPEDTLHMFPYPNVFNSSEACMGKAFEKAFKLKSTDTLALATAQVLNAFWSADFNEDAGPNTWYAPWRTPMANLPKELREAISIETIEPWKLLRFYSEQALGEFVRFAFPISNNLNTNGDTITDLMRVLQACEPTNFSTSDGLLAALRMLHANATKLARQSTLAEKGKLTASSTIPRLLAKTDYYAVKDKF